MQFFQRIVPFIAAGLLLFSVSASAVQANAQKNNNNNAPAATNTQERADAVNINEATVEQLQDIKGIGKSKAQAIVQYREKQGKFQTVEDLSKVKGLGDKTVAMLVEQNPGRLIAQ